MNGDDDQVRSIGVESPDAINDTGEVTLRGRPAETDLGQRVDLDRGFPIGLAVLDDRNPEVTGFREGAGDFCARPAARVDPGTDPAAPDARRRKRRISSRAFGCG